METKLGWVAAWSCRDGRHQGSPSVPGITLVGGKAWCQQRHGKSSARASCSRPILPLPRMICRGP
jgi:hypothetical protein